MKIIILLVVVVVAFVWYDTNLNQSGSNGAYTETVVSSHSDFIEEELPNYTFKCDGRTYCSQMTSCEEAKFFLENCPDPKMDGDDDGIPCESQWCH